MQDLSRSITTVEHEVKESSQNTDLDIREMLGLDKTLQGVQGELANNFGKLTSISEYIEHEQQKLDVIAKDYKYTDEQRKEVQQRMDRLKEELVLDWSYYHKIKKNYKVNLL